MTNNDLKAFFADRPALKIKVIADEAGISRRTLFHYLKPDPSRNMTEKTTDKLMPVMMKYGWNTNE